MKYTDLVNHYIAIGDRLRFIGMTGSNITAKHMGYDAAWVHAVKAALKAERAAVQMSRLLPNNYIDFSYQANILNGIPYCDHRANGIDIAFPYICGVRNQLERELFNLNGDINQQLEYRAMAA